jgi:hypothetical protein
MVTFWYQLYFPNILKYVVYMKVAFCKMKVIQLSYWYYPCIDLMYFYTEELSSDENGVANLAFDVLIPYSYFHYSKWFMLKSASKIVESILISCFYNRIAIRIGGSHSYGYEQFCLLEYKTT